MKMHEYVKTAFEDEEVLSRCIPGYRHSPIQMEYALSVADTLIAGTRSKLTAVSLLEADTGIGKSLGYLIPATWLAAKGKRVAVSTHKNQLQQQLLSTAFPAAAEVARTLLGVELRAAPRIGMRHFVSPARALRVIEERELQKKRGDKADPSGTRRAQTGEDASDTGATVSPARAARRMATYSALTTG